MTPLSRINAVQVVGREGLFDLTIEQGRITSLTPRPDAKAAGAGQPVLSPGFHDAHLHLFSLASESSYLRVPKDLRGRDQFAELLRKAAAETDPGDWLRVRGLEHEVSLDGWSPDREWLDQQVGDVPLRIQHASLRMDLLNSAALAQIGNALEGLPGVRRDDQGRPTGKVLQQGAAISAARPKPALDVIERRVRRASERLAACGITAIQDASESNTADQVELLLDLAERGVLRQHTRAMISGARIRDYADLTPLVEGIGHAKITAIEAQLELDLLIQQGRDAREHGLPIAIHAATEAEVVAAVAVVEAVKESHGPARLGGLDRIEHATISDDDVADALVASGAALVANPGLVSRYGDRYLKQAKSEGWATLHRVRTWLDRGVPLALASDAPVGPLEPLASVAAAVNRLTPQGQVAEPQEAIAELPALAAATRGAELTFAGPGPARLAGAPSRPDPALVVRAVQVCMRVADPGGVPSAMGLEGDPERTHVGPSGG